MATQPAPVGSPCPRPDFNGKKSNLLGPGAGKTRSFKAGPGDTHPYPASVFV